MIAFLEGTLESKNPAQVVLNVNGVGYELLIPLSTYDKLPKPGETVHILTHFHVREDAQTLYGFSSPAERQLFQLLLSVSKIGPKIALSVLSGLAVRELKRAVVEGDKKRLSSISGVGTKMAERMILELRDKFSEGEALEAVAGEETPGDIRSRDAVLALVALGYKQQDAQKMLLAVDARDEPDLGVEDLVRKALLQ
ncbi:MAG: Holliday junction branch migration protein RuvA [Verrucomicrobiota bacterium]|jgi:Holliday junction DNA helicase RuvA